MAVTTPADHSGRNQPWHSSHPIPAPCQWFARLASALDRRSAPRLALLFLGAVLARGRRTVTSWIRAAGLSGQYQSCSLAVAAAGRKAETTAAYLVLWVVKPLVGEAERLNLALDDTPTKRYGPHVQGAGIHHNPTPGPAGSPYVYGHVFVVLAILVTHKASGTIALPLLSRLYVRKKDLPAIDPKHRPEFRTKMELAVELLQWLKPWLSLLKLPIWVVADGAYAKKDFLKPAMSLGMTVVSRLRRDGALRTLPGPKPPRRRGPAPTYGPDVIDLAKRAGQRRGWSSERPPRSRSSGSSPIPINRVRNSSLRRWSDRRHSTLGYRSPAEFEESLTESPPHPLSLGKVRQSHQINFTT
jgi:hypothetical protein